MEGFLVLADSGNTEQATGKIHLLGAGWSLTGPAVPSSAVAGFLRVPWDDVKDDLTFHLRLVDADRNPVEVPLIDGKTRMVGFQGQLGIGDDRPKEGVERQVPMNLSFALSIPPLPLTPDGVYEWILDVGDVEVASVRFGVRPGDADD
ncbi:hypothetical protein Nocox_09595 [Nonomuraea coxensis DSM 45129]|uniref:Uncharacterized protein n=1 Tax=Nonomuraea coxensis DSM 45129 TaxID=1122611 RepID=A0ABX8TYC6_9ACTN|nr:hypothetical protein [Nonomuraea coxensis]QYC39539.1 hypothetical protein Nocox_09595 [Nonomuraea coxensis DSM 45129]